MVHGAFRVLMRVVVTCEDKLWQFGLGEPAEVAFTALHFASDEAKHVTGAEMAVYD